MPERPVERAVEQMDSFEETFLKIDSVLTPREKVVFYLWMDGAGPTEQAKLLGYSRQKVEARMIRIRMKASLILGIQYDKQIHNNPPR